jgi:hypothetical protein
VIRGVTTVALLLLLDEFAYCSPFSASQKANWDEQVRFNKTAQASIYFAPEPYKSIILKQQPPPGEHNARVSKQKVTFYFDSKLLTAIPCHPIHARVLL